MNKTGKRINALWITALFLLTTVLTVATGLFGKEKAYAATQIHNSHFADLPLPTAEKYAYKDWRQTTLDYLEYVFDESNVYDAANGDEGGYMPAMRRRKIGRYADAENIDAYFGETGNKAWGLPSYIGDQLNDLEVGEGVTVLSALASAALVGVPELNNYLRSDGTRFNFVKSAVAFYSREEHVILNTPTGKSGGSFWYQLLPQVCFSLLASQYGDTETYLNDIVTESSRNLLSAVRGMGGVNADFNWLGYSLALDEPVTGNWREPDAAAGIAYVLYSAYSLNTLRAAQGKETYATASEIEQFRLGAIWCMNYLERIDFSPFYEVLTFLAPYLAARMNAEQGTDYNVEKMIGWTVNGSSAVRGGWGMIGENWGDRYTAGLMGSVVDGGGYAFAMNTFDAVLGFVPLIRYDNRFAEDIAKWMLCVSQSAQAYFPEKSPFTGGYRNTPAGSVWNGDYQSGKWIESASDPRASFIPYEGLRKHRKSVTYNSSSSASRTTVSDDNSPYASGDGYTYNWNRHTDYGLYGAGHMGFFGAVIDQTNVERILRIDLDALDIYNFSGDVEFAMYYNPYETEKSVTVPSATDSRLWNTMTKSYVGSESGGNVTFTMPAGATMVLAQIPAGKDVTVKAGAYKCGDVFLTEEKGSASLAVYAAASGGNAIAAGAEMSGTVYAQIGYAAPEGSTAQHMTLLFADTELYSGAPTADRIAVDTTALRNGRGTMTAIVTFDNGKSERAQAAVRVLNADTTYVVSYADDDAMQSAWENATREWQALHSVSDHDAEVTKAADGGITVSNMSARSYAWATSEQFYVDFSRAPYLEYEISTVGHQYSLKIFVEGDENAVADKYTGRYLVNDTADTNGVKKIDLAEAVANAGLEIDGVAKVSVKIAAVGTGGTDTFVTLKSFSVYHTYATPAPTEPAQYEWGFAFSAPYLSLWTTAEGNVTARYTQAGEIVLSATDVRGAVSGPAVSASVSQSPVLTVQPENLTGSYYAGIAIEGYDGIYVLADSVTDTARLEISVADEMANRYGITLSQTLQISVVVGVNANSTLTLDRVETFYRLPEWGTTIEGQAFDSWERQRSLGARASVTYDAGNRAVFTNMASAGNETVSGGRRGAMTVNFDYDPELAITVRAASGEWRMGIAVFGQSAVTTLIDWTRESGREPMHVNLKEVLGEHLSGATAVYLNVEIRGGGNSVTVQSIQTSYRKTQPSFGNTYTAKEAATWHADENGGTVAIENGLLTVEKTRKQNGIVTPRLHVDADRAPLLKLEDVRIASGTQLRVTATVGDMTYEFAPVRTSGTAVLDVRALTGFAASREFDVSFALDPENLSGVGRAKASMAGIGFLYMLDAPANLHADGDVLLWEEVPYAKEYAYSVFDGNGVLARKGSAGVARLNLANLQLPDGVYYVELRAAADGCEPSQSTRSAFKRGDIPSVTLGTPQISLSGTQAKWTELSGTTAYRYELRDKDTGAIIDEGTTPDAYLDLTQSGLPAFNYTLTVQAMGDGAAYLSGTPASYGFYTDVKGRYLPITFTTMSAGANNAFAQEVEGADAAVITVPNNGEWGNIVSLPFALDFDGNPVLRIAFGEQNVGGYHISINIEGVSYHLCDDTYRFDGNDVYFDIVEVLASREDGIKGLHGEKNVQIVFGVTSVLTGGTPSVQFESAYVYQMTEGEGVARLGQLSTPVLTVSESERLVRWAAVEHADTYTVVLSNEFGVLKTEEVTAAQFSYDELQVEGEYTVSVTAGGGNYYDSETAQVSFILRPAGAKKSTLSGGAIALIVIAAVVAAGGVFALWWFVFRKKAVKAEK